jgi:hypothetical protein
MIDTSLSLASNLPFNLLPCRQDDALAMTSVLEVHYLLYQTTDTCFFFPLFINELLCRVVTSLLHVPTYYI